MAGTAFGSYCYQEQANRDPNGCGDMFDLTDVVSAASTASSSRISKSHLRILRSYDEIRCLLFIEV